MKEPLKNSRRTPGPLGGSARLLSQAESYLGVLLKLSDAPFGLLKHRTELSHRAHAPPSPSVCSQGTGRDVGAARLATPGRMK